MSRTIAKRLAAASRGIGQDQQPADDVFNGRLTVSIDETATALGVGRDTVYILIQDGRLIASKLGARTVVHTDSIRRLLITTRLVLPPRARRAKRTAKADAPQATISPS